MAKLVFGMNQSLDGYVDHLEMRPSPALFRHFIEQVRGLTGSVYGRRMYEVMRIWDEDLPEWGASNATNAVAHVAHKRTSASVRGGVDQSASASPAAGPAVSGSEAHANRTNHSVIGAIGLRGLRERSIYYGPHGRRP